MDYMTFNARTDVNAYDCTRGCTDTERESARKVDSGKKISRRTGESNLRQRRDGPKLYQLSYTCHTETDQDTDADSSLFMSYIQKVFKLEMEGVYMPLGASIFEAAPSVEFIYLVFTAP